MRGGATEAPDEGWTCSFFVGEVFVASERFEILMSFLEISLRWALCANVDDFHIFLDLAQDFDGSEELC